MGSNPIYLIMSNIHELVEAEENKELLEFTEKVLSLINTPEKWTRDVFARDAHGVSVASLSSDAVCFCLRGACIKANRGSTPRDFDCFFANVARSIGYTVNSNFIAAFNDHHTTTHADIVKILNEMILRLKA